MSDADPRILSAEEFAECVENLHGSFLRNRLSAHNLALTQRIEELEGGGARAQALGEVADYISMYGGMSGGPESWADLSEAIRNDTFGATAEQRKIMLASDDADDLPCARCEEVIPVTGTVIWIDDLPHCLACAQLRSEPLQ